MSVKSIKDMKEGPGPTISVGDKISILYRVCARVSNGDTIEIESNCSPDNPLEIEYSADALLEDVFKGMSGMRSGGGSQTIIVDKIPLSAKEITSTIEGGKLDEIEFVVSVLEILDTQI